MLNELGIYAMSPELGTPNPRTNEFFIVSPKDLKIMVEKNSDWIFYACSQLFPNLLFSEGVFTISGNKVSINLNMENRGIGIIKSQDLVIAFNKTLYESEAFYLDD